MTSKSPLLLPQNKLTSHINVSCDLSASLDNSLDSVAIIDHPRLSFIAKPTQNPRSSIILQPKPEIETHNDVLEKIRKVLLTQNRSKDDTLLLAKHIENTSFFHDFPIKGAHDLQLVDALLYMSQHVSYEKVSAGDIIFEEGTKSEGKTYLILTGEVNVVVDKIEEFIRNGVALNIKSYETLALFLRRNYNMPVTTNEMNTTKRASRLDFSVRKFQQPKETNDNIEASHDEEEDVAVESFLLQAMTQDSQIKSNSESPIIPMLKAGSFEEAPLDLEDDVETPEMKSSKAVGSPNFTGFTRKRHLTRSTFKLPENSEQPHGALVSTQLFCRTNIQKLSETYGTVVDKLQKGDNFGGTSASLAQNIMTVIAKTDCEFITISEELSMKLKSRFEKQNRRKLSFFIDFFPGMESIRNKNLLYDLFFRTKEMPFDMNAYITTQDTIGKTSYMLYEGTCSLYMKLAENEDYNEMLQYGDQEDQNKNDGILVCKLSPGMFIGDEILFNSDRRYEFTVKAASTNVKVIAINLNHMAHEFPASILKDLKQMYQTKQQHFQSSAFQRVKLKVAVFPMMKSPLLKRSKTSILKRESPCQSARILQEISSSPSREIPVVDEKISSLFRISKVFAGDLVTKQPQVLRNPSPTRLQSGSGIALKRKLLAQLSQRDVCTGLDNISSMRLKFGHEEKVSPLLKRAREKSQLNEFGNSREARDTKSLETKQAVPKLNLLGITNEVEKPQAQAKTLTHDLMKRLKAAQSRASKRNWNNISISMVTDKSARVGGHEDSLKMLDNDKHLQGMNTDRRDTNMYSSQMMRRSEANKSALSFRKTGTLKLDGSSPDSSPVKHRRSIMTRQKSRGQNDSPIYGLIPKGMGVKNEKEKVKLSKVSVEAGFFLGLGNNKLLIHSERRPE